ncbi:MAG: hypothetical protein IPK60_00930 [Sandaracinaceae bacterium]|nr:hypothetical protein [Sandaracinaceae bacterium]
MRLLLCQYVPGLFYVVAVTACFSNHNVGPSLVDAGTAPDSGAAHDAGAVVPFCTGPHDVAEEVDFASAHFDSAANPSTPFTMQTFLNGCYCGATLRCEVSVDAAARTVALTHTLCSPVDLACAGCELDFGATCELPGLAAGAWTVTSNRVRAFPLFVGASELVGPAAATLEQTEGHAMYMCEWPGDQVLNDFADSIHIDECESVNLSAGFARASISLSVDNVDCFATAGSCRVTNIGDNRLLIDPLVKACTCATCGACAPGNYPTRHVCETPALAPGTYTLVSANPMAGPSQRLVIPPMGADALIHCE